MLSDELQIFYHTHSVAKPVPFVNSFQSLAWKVSALEAKREFAFRQLGASFLQKRAHFVSWSAARATGILIPLLFRSFFNAK
jgi:hypothetical protein